MLSASPIEVGYTLDDLLWTQCEGAILCSATLRALNSFQHFRMQAGLSDNDGSQYLHVDSPFNYQQNAQLVIADMPVEPTDPQFTDELVRKLAKIINVEEATLVLFSSHWQMKQVAQALRKQKFSLKVQGEESRQEIIAHHKNKIDKNQGSIIFGSQSFSEGLDLPGKLLTHVIITKLPFAVPTSPVEEAQSEYISAKGGNPFLSITVPDASKKLVQACGRLLRSEQDTGKITILDRRLVSKRYGKALLDALPPFARVVE